MKSVLKKIVDFLGFVMPGIAFLVIFVTFMIGIVSRYFFRTAVPWTYEVSILGYMYAMFFGVGKAIEDDSHVVFSLVYDVVSPKKKSIFRIIYNAFLVFLLVACFVPCCKSLVSKQMVTGVLKLPYKIVFAPFIYMLAETIIRSAVNIVNAVKELKEGGAQA